MNLMLGVGSAIYWSTTNALLQELSPATKLIAANATILIAVQNGMATAGAMVGFTYKHAGLAGILAIDGTTYFTAAICLLWPSATAKTLPHHSLSLGGAADRAAGEIGPGATRRETWKSASSMFSWRRFTADIAEGLRYLAEQPLRLSHWE